MRKTKIICTIGPVSQSEEKLKELILKKWCPFQIDINSFGLYEIYPAKRIKKFECK